MVKVWDLLVRVLHWSLVLAVTAAWLTRRGGAWVHEWLGYAALLVVAMRVVWGFTRSGHARFRSFVRSPAATLAYARAAVSRKEPRHVGHNPLGGWMIVALLTMVAATGVSGWLYTTTMFWGDERVVEIHEACSNVLFALVALHLLGVVFTSIRQRENLLAAMISGRKRDDKRGDKRNGDV